MALSGLPAQTRDGSHVSGGYSGLHRPGRQSTTRRERSERSLGLSLREPHCVGIDPAVRDIDCWAVLEDRISTKDGRQEG
jgi:hypothetical protein